MTKRLFIIPARGGSKSIPGKNIKLLGGKPLIAYTLNAAKAAENPLTDTIFVSTDDPEIRRVVEGLGVSVPFMRPAIYATDTATTESVVMHALEAFKQKGKFFDLVILLQPTSPFRTAAHLLQALALHLPQNGMIVSVKEAKANPYFVLFEEDDQGVLRKVKEGNFTRRQDCPKVFELNGAIYIFGASTFLLRGFAGMDVKHKYLMDDLASLDIDGPVDWIMAEAIISSEPAQLNFK